MKLFKGKNKGKEAKKAKEPEVKFDRMELEEKAKNGTPMTYAETKQLEKERQKDVLYQVLRVLGLFAVLFVVVLMVGTCLYPYSIFNLFGNGNAFWDYYSELPYWVNNSDASILELYGVTVDSKGFVSATDLMSHAFNNGLSARANFICLGSWSVVLLATVGFVVVVISTLYVVAINIKDLIDVIKRLGVGASYIATDISKTAAKSIGEGISGDTGISLNSKSTKPEPHEETEEEHIQKLKNEIDKEEQEKNSLKEAEPTVEPVSPKTVVTTPVATVDAEKKDDIVTSKKTVKTYANATDADLDKLLSGK